MSELLKFPGVPSTGEGWHSRRLRRLTYGVACRLVGSTLEDPAVTDVAHGFIANRATLQREGVHEATAAAQVLAWVDAQHTEEPPTVTQIIRGLELGSSVLILSSQLVRQAGPEATPDSILQGIRLQVQQEAA